MTMPNATAHGSAAAAAATAAVSVEPRDPRVFLGEAAEQAISELLRAASTGDLHELKRLHARVSAARNGMRAQPFLSFHIAADVGSRG
jgi:ethanolamine ammonia-lyase small subunit